MTRARSAAHDELFDNLRIELRSGTLILAALAQLRTEHYGYTLRHALSDVGMEIEENARMILDRLGSVHLAMEKVEDQYEKLGTHLTNAQKTHTELGKKFEKVSGQIDNLASVTLAETEQSTALPEAVINGA